MEKHIEILKNWVKISDKFFDDKYGKIMESFKNKSEHTNREIIDYNEAMTAFTFLKLWRRRLEKMIGGQQMNARALKKIENLPNLETTHPNVLRR